MGKDNSLMNKSFLWQTKEKMYKFTSSNHEYVNYSNNMIITLHPSDWQKFKRATTFIVGWNVMKRILSYIAGGNVKCYSLWGKQSGIIYYN